MSGPTTHSPALREFLGRVRPNLPLRESGDILLELEAAVLDRADDLARLDGRTPSDDDVQRAVVEMGEPDAIAASYAEPRIIVAPEAARSFLLRTGTLFVVHMVLIGIVTALDHPFHVGLFPVQPVGPHGLLSVLAAAVHAGLLDVGLMTGVYVLCGAFRRFEMSGDGSFAVEARPRQALGRALFALLATAVLCVFRDGVFVVIAGGKAHPLFTSWAAEVMPFLAVLLVGAAVKDTCYGIFGERRLTVGMDALHGLVGVVVMLYLLGGDALLAVPPIEELAGFHEPVNAFLSQLGGLVLAAAALLFGAKTLRRSVRVAQI